MSACDLSKDQTYNEIPRSGQSFPDLAYVFDLSAVPVVTISLSVDEWNTILTNYDTLPENEVSVHADFIFDKQGQIETNLNVGLRIRGNYSRRRPEGDNPNYSIDSNPGVLHNSGTTYYHSTHFRIGFTDFTNGTKFHGLRNINFKWFKDDPNYAREIYCYDLFRRFGVTTAPKASYARLYIHLNETDETLYFGVYAMIEALDQSYLNAHFTNNNKGYLWKCLSGDMSFSSGMGIAENTLTTAYTPPYDLKTQKEEFTNAQNIFVNFINQLNALGNGTTALQSWLLNNMDVDGFLKTLAVTAIVGSWDSYWYTGGNYYFYFDEDGKGHYIPYDFDNTLGTSNGVNSGTFDLTRLQDYGRPLVQKVFSIAAFRTTYKNYLTQLIKKSNPYFDITYSTNRIKAWQNMIQPYMIGQDVVGDAENYSNMIADFPARAWAGTGWGNQDFYRLFSGDDSGNGNTLPGANFFKTRSQFAASQLGLAHMTW